MAIFDYTHPKIIVSTFSFLEFVSAWKKWLYFICSFLSPVTKLVTPIFDHAHPQKFQSSFNLCGIITTCKKSVLSVLSWDTANFRVQRPDWPHSFLNMPHQKRFNQLSIFVNLHQHAQNEAISSICPGKILDLKISQSEWLRVFWAISQE